MKQTNFMTTKEKDYVADIFLKNIKHSSSGIDYSVFFDDNKEKSLCPLSEPLEKKVPYVVFGKEVKKSFSSPHHHVGLSLDSLEDNYKYNYKLENLLQKLIFYNTYRHEHEDTTVQDVLECVKGDIVEFVRYDKFFILLSYLYKLIESDDVKDIYICLVNNYEALNNPTVLKTFLNEQLTILPSVNYEEIQKSFVEKFMYRDSGILLATSLLINNNELASYFYYYIIVNDTSYLDSEHIWMFLAVLISLVDEEKKFKLVEITRDKIFELKRASSERFDCTKYFLKAIGLNKEDVIE